MYNFKDYVIPRCSCGVGVETTMFCVAKIVLLSCLISPTEVLKSMLNSETGMI